MAEGGKKAGSEDPARREGAGAARQSLRVSSIDQTRPRASVLYWFVV